MPCILKANAALQPSTSPPFIHISWIKRIFWCTLINYLQLQAVWGCILYFSHADDGLFCPLCPELPVAVNHVPLLSVINYDAAATFCIIYGKTAQFIHLHKLLKYKKYLFVVVLCNFFKKKYEFYLFQINKINPNFLFLKNFLKLI